MLGGVIGAGITLITAGCNLPVGQSFGISRSPLRFLSGQIAATMKLLEPIGTETIRQLDVLRSHHQKHLDALRHRTRTDPPNPTWPSLPTDPKKRVAAAERALAELAGKLCLRIPDIGNRVDAARQDDFVALLGSIAACQRVHQWLVSGTGVSDSQDWSMGGRGRDALPVLQSALDGEHAAIYGYGALGGRLGKSDRSSALTAQEVHRDRRDALAESITVRGGQPHASEARYELPIAVTDPNSARQLAARLEDDCAGQWRQALSTVQPGDRDPALRALTHCAVTAAKWRPGSAAANPAFPGV
jgi:hypothetical protein